MLRPCIKCGKVGKAARCAECLDSNARDRPSATERGYGASWRRLSRKLREQQPWCSQCGTPSDLTVDHIIPLSKGGTNDLANLRVLCRPCNSSRRSQPYT